MFERASCPDDPEPTALHVGLMALGALSALLNQVLKRAVTGTSQGRQEARWLRKMDLFVTREGLAGRPPLWLREADLRFTLAETDANRHANQPPISSES
jgi:hypothetical protein